MSKNTYEIELSSQTVLWLEALLKASEYGETTVPGLLVSLADHAADGARRPGAWERSWINQAMPLDDDPWNTVQCEHSNATEFDGMTRCPDCGLLGRTRALNSSG